MIKAISMAEFEKIAQTKQGAYVIDFWASWCGPCKMFAPVFDKLSDEINDVSFCKVNVDDEPELAAKLRIASIPTILFVKDGVVTAKSVGFMPEDELRDFIEENK